MRQVEPLTVERHGRLRWRRYSNLLFASGTTVAYLSASEINQATLAFPTAFVRNQGGWALAAVLGLLANQNVYVDPNGSWLARYMPASLRGYPFLIAAQPNREPVFCVDENSGLLTDGSDGEPLFNEAGILHPSVTQIFSLLVATARGESLLLSVCSTLHDAGMLEEWPIQIAGEGGTQQVAGLYRVNEAALNALDDSTHIALRQSGALGIAYAQILSTGNLAILGEHLQSRAQREAAERARAAVKPMLTLPEDNSIDWDWSKIGR